MSGRLLDQYCAAICPGNVPLSLQSLQISADRFTGNTELRTEFRDAHFLFRTDQIQDLKHSVLLCHVSTSFKPVISLPGRPS